MTCPLLIINGMDDAITNKLDVTRLLCQHGGVNKRIELEGILHSIIDHPSEQVASIIHQWACEQQSRNEFEMMPSVISVPRMVFSLRDYLNYVFISVYVLGILFTRLTTQRSLLYCILWLPCKLYKAITNGF